MEVTDTGIGIGEEEHVAVFGRFYRGNAVAEKSGVGIGLYLARSIMPVSYTHLYRWLSCQRFMEGNCRAGSGNSGRDIVLPSVPEDESEDGGI